MKCRSQSGCVGSPACFGGSEAFRNKLKYEDLPFILFQTGTNCIDSLEATEMKEKKRKQFALNKWKANIQKANEANENAEKSSMMPFHKDGMPACNPISECNTKTRKKVHFQRTNMCGPQNISNAQRETSMGAPEELSGSRAPMNSTSASDSALMAKIKDAVCFDIKPKLSHNFRISNAFPNYPFRMSNEPTPVIEKQFLNDIYKSSTQSAFEDIPFDDSAYRRRVYPLNTLDKSADPIVLQTYQKKTNPPTASWQPRYLPADEYDKQLLRRDFSKGTRPIDFCAENIRADQISSYSGCLAPKENWMEIDNCKIPYKPLTVVRTGTQYDPISKSCDTSYLRRLQAETKALRDEIQQKKIDWEKKRFAEGTPELPGTYKASYSTALPPGWSVKELEIIEKVKPKSLWMQAVNLPEPKCFCKKSVAFESNQTLRKS